MLTGSIAFISLYNVIKFKTFTTLFCSR